SLSHNKVHVELFPSNQGGPSAGVEHIELALWADLMVIAPITATTIAKLHYGIADNLLTSLALALRVPLIIAPAMDMDMYLNDVTQENIGKLKEKGVIVVDPEEGELASGLSGIGRLAEVEKILQKVNEFLGGHHRDLLGIKILVTAGPTQEPIDAVRFISNKSSGKMGFALAAAAANRGAEVKLITGPVCLHTPRNVSRVDVVTSDQMHELVMSELEWSDVLVMTAAVADYKVENPAARKIKKDEFKKASPRIDLIETVDILEDAGKKKGKRILVGFALETNDVIKNAMKKMAAKSLDLVVVNNPLEEGAGFGGDTNRVTILKPDGTKYDLPLMTKYDVALKILDEIKELHNKRLESQ
ncbi:MAG: bifunctional phosphopantothenoylcysteine decarboxylase/phosphopantothenate--cysteine ligase CoaBC, partial [Candidatus Kryptoniota bacterium]